MFNFLKHTKIKKAWIKAPFDGEIIQLEQVPDKVFAQKMVGDGVAINPRDEWVTSPVEGKIVQIFPTCHALGIKTNEGIEVLIHLGIETVKLKGKGFTPLVEKGQAVCIGDRLMRVDWDYIRQNAESAISPIIITNGNKVREMQVLQYGAITAGQDLLMITLSND